MRAASHGPLSSTATAGRALLVHPRGVRHLSVARATHNAKRTGVEFFEATLVTSDRGRGDFALHAAMRQSPIEGATPDRVQLPGSKIEGDFALHGDR